MKDKNNEHYNHYDDGINFIEFFNILWLGKRVIISITFFISMLGLIYSLQLPNIYKSNAVLNPANASNGISKSLQNYSGLAGFAGISLPTDTDEGNSAKAILKLTSLSFFEDKILPNIFLPNLMALKSWDDQTNTLNYDQNIYDYNSDKWVRNFSYPNKQIPSAQESFKVFLKNISLGQDRDNAFVTLSIKHQSPIIAKEWTELMVNEINSFYRNKDKIESEKAITYLNEKIKTTSESEVKIAIAQLLKEETQKLALIEANDFYVFEYIDPPAVMEEKSEPQRALICILSALLGIIFGVICIFIKQYLLKLKGF